MGRIGEHHGGPFFAHQRDESFGIKGAAAEDAMAVEAPQIAGLAHRRARWNLGHDVGRVVSPIRGVFN